MEKLTTFKHHEDGMLATEENKNPFVLVKDVKRAFTEKIYEIRQRQGCWGEEHPQHKIYDEMIAEFAKFIDDMFD